MEKVEELLKNFARLPEPLQDKLLLLSEGAVMAMDTLKAAPAQE